jgi:hypothetical protein
MSDRFCVVMNNKRLRAAVAAGLIGGGLVAGLPAGAATVANASVETVTAGTPACWTPRGVRSDLTVVTGRTGARAVQVRGRGAVTEAVEFGTVHSASCGIRVTAGRAYAVGAWYQANAMVQPVVYTYAAATGWKKWLTGSPYAGSTPWQKIETMTPAVPPGTTMIGLGFATAGNAKVVVDDASVVDGTALLASAVTGRTPVWTAPFPATPALVTNEYAYWNPKKVASRSADWEVTSGSLFAANGGGYTGRIDSGRPDVRSATFTNSSIFRLRTTATAYDNVRVGFTLTVAELGSTARTPATAFDGVHIWLRYRSQYHLYAASVARRDGGVVLKKKCPGGPSNEGTYYTLGKEVKGFPLSLGRSFPVSATAQTNPSGTVTVSLAVGGRTIVTATDTGIGCAPITGPAAVGIRGDNARFYFRDFAVARTTL